MNVSEIMKKKPSWLTITKPKKNPGTRNPAFAALMGQLSSRSLGQSLALPVSVVSFCKLASINSAEISS